MPQTPRDVAPIAEQRRLSQRVVALVSAAIGRCYRLDVVGHDIGSFARGTNADDTVDIDVLCLGIPHDSARGSHDWTADGTYGAQAARELTDVDQVRAVDPPLGEAITAIVHQMGMTGIAESPRFQWLRTAQGSPDVFFRVEATRPAASTIGVDVTLAHGRENFGLEHAQRFERYLQRVAEADGAERALALLEDIRHCKRLVKTVAAPRGDLDKRAKVPGFLVEGLFTSGRTPRTFAQVVQEVRALCGAVGQDDLPRRPEFIVDQAKQLVDSGLTVAEVAGFATSGGFRTLLRVAGA